MSACKTAVRPLSATVKVRGGCIVAKGLVGFIVCVTALGASGADRSREHVAKIVSQIQRADYEGDRAALKRLHGQLANFVTNKELAPQVQYWRGFALWRRAINGFNESVDPEELKADLKQALEEFNDASAKAPTWAEAKVGAISCLGFIGFAFTKNNPALMQDPKIKELIVKIARLRKEADELAPQNPRLTWVMGPAVWNTPPDKGGGQAKAIELYEKALVTIRSQKGTARDPLEPSWGEPELLMSLAWSNFKRTTPDLGAAEQYARSALELVPHWHYVRDILLPQIREAKRKQS